MKKRISLTLLSLLCAISLTACANSSNTSSSASTASAAASASESSVKESSAAESSAESAVTESSIEEKSQSVSNSESSVEDQSQQESEEELKGMTWEEFESVKNKFPEITVEVNDKGSYSEDNVVRYGRIVYDENTESTDSDSIKKAVYDANNKQYHSGDIVEITGVNYDNFIAYYSPYRNRMFNYSDIALLPEDYKIKDTDNVFKIEEENPEVIEYITSKNTPEDAVRYGKTIEFVIPVSPIYDSYHPIPNDVNLCILSINDDNTCNVYSFGESVTIDAAKVELFPDNYTPDFKNGKWYGIESNYRQ